MAVSATNVANESYSPCEREEEILECEIEGSHSNYS